MQKQIRRLFFLVMPVLIREGALKYNKVLDELF